MEKPNLYNDRRPVTNEKSFLKSLYSLHSTLEVHVGVKLPEPIKLLIWLLGLTFAIGLTSYAFVPLIREYRENNVVTQVQVILLDNHVRPPRLIVSLPRGKIINKYGDDLMILAVSLYVNNGNCGPEAREICDNLKNASMDVWNGRIEEFDRTSLDAFYGDLTLAFIEKIFSNPKPEEYIDGETWFRNEVISSAFYIYISWLGWVDYNLSPIPVDHEIPFTVFPAVDFSEKFENFDSNYELLHSHMLKFLCTRIKYMEFDYHVEFRDPIPRNKTCSDLLLNSTSPVFIGFGLSFALPEKEIPTIQEYRIRINQQPRSLGNSSLLANVGPDPLTRMYLYADAGSLYSCILDREYAQQIFLSPLESRKGGQKVTVKYKVQMRAKSSRLPCMNGTSVTTCFLLCTKLWIIQECNCAPFYLKNTIEYPNKENIPACKPSSYAKCNITFLPQKITDQCMEKCKRPCDYTIFSWQINYESFETEANVSEFSILMIPLLDTFAEFTCILKDTPEQFFSQLAGVGSFYLGINALTVVSVIIWCLELWKRWRKRGIGRTRNVRNIALVKGGNCRETLEVKDGREKWSEIGSDSPDGDEFCGKGCEESARKREANLQARWREDIEKLLETKYCIKKRGISL